MKIQSIVNEVSVEFHDELNPALWQNNEIKLDVQVRLLEIAKRFIKFLNVPDLNLLDVYFMGSNAAYVYTHFSDIDLHVMVDDQNNDLKELYDAKKRLWNEQHNISIKGYDVELYVQDIKDPNASMGIYSLLQNKWVKEPEKVEASIDDAGVQQKFKYIAKKIMRGIKKRDHEYLDAVASEIKDLRKSGLQRAGEFSIENLAFKELRNGGYLEKLSNARQELEDEALSLDEGPNQIRENAGQVTTLDGSELTELSYAIEDLQEDIDGKSVWAGEDDDQILLKNLEKDYRALEAIRNVVKNNMIAIKKNNTSNYFLYAGDHVDIESGIAGIHFSIENDLVVVRWLGSYNESGRNLLTHALEKAKSLGAKKVKVSAKWESEGFYSKMGFSQDTDHKESDPFAKALTGGTKLMSKEIAEAPVTDYQTLGNFNKPGSFTTTKYDPAIVRNPKAQQKVYRFFERSPYKFRLYPLNIPGARKFSETGRVNLAWLEKNLPQAAEIVKKNPPNDDIIVFYVSNTGSEKVPFTPWIMAHRMGHAFRPNNYAWGEYVSYWVDQMKQLLNGYYGADIGRMEDPRYIALQNALGTMKSARDGKLSRPYEFLYELLAQYINTGEIKLNLMPKTLGYGKQVYGKHTRALRLLPTDDAENRNHIEMLERDLAYHLDTILGEAQNKIFVM